LVLSLSFGTFANQTMEINTMKLESNHYFCRSLGLLSIELVSKLKYS